MHTININSETVLKAECGGNKLWPNMHLASSGFSIRIPSLSFYSHIAFAHLRQKCRKPLVCSGPKLSLYNLEYGAQFLNPLRSSWEASKQNRTTKEHHTRALACIWLFEVRRTILNHNTGIIWWEVGSNYSLQDLRLLFLAATHATTTHNFGNLLSSKRRFTFLD